MNSKRQDRINTSCQDCVFAIYDNNTQTGCKFNRLEEADFFEAYNERGNFYVVDGYCGLLRHNDWNNGVVDLDKLEQEISFSYFVIIDAFSLSSIDLKNLSIEYKYKDKVSFHIFGPTIKQKEILKLRKKLNCQASITSYRNYTINDKIQNLKCSYLVYVNNSNAINFDLNDYNALKNKRHKKDVVFDFNGVRYISCLAYQYAEYQTQSKNFDKNLEYLIEQKQKNEKK